MKRKEQAVILSNDPIAQDIYSLRLRVTFADEVRAGQFVNLFLTDTSRLLPRPISICEADAKHNEIRLVYRVQGAGTKDISAMKAGQGLAVMGPLGNGFPYDKAGGKRVILAGGGIGIPPMLAVCKALFDEDGENSPRSVTFAAGYRSSDTYLLEDMKALAPVLIATDDGSLGTHGTVLDAISKSGLEADIIFACGPKPMLRALKEYALSRQISCFVSMEERMACGVGACLGCVCKMEKTDEHSRVHYARVCKDGPVFRAEEVDLT